MEFHVMLSLLHQYEMVLLV